MCTLNPPTAAVTSNTTGFVAGTLPIAIVTTGQGISFIADVRAVYGAPDAGALFSLTAPAVLAVLNTTQQTVTSFAIPAGVLNQTGKMVRLKAAWQTNMGTTGGLQIIPTLGGINLATINTTNINANTNMLGSCEFMLLTANPGVNGNIEAHGFVVQTINTASVANVASFADVTTAVSANVNLTGALTLALTALTNGAGVNFTARYATLEILN